MNFYNGQRQAGVNYKAEAVGASSGTAPRDGVPGTGVGGGYGYYPKSYGYGPYPGYYPGNDAYRAPAPCVDC